MQMLLGIALFMQANERQSRNNAPLPLTVSHSFEASSETAALLHMCSAGHFSHATLCHAMVFENKWKYQLLCTLVHRCINRCACMAVAPQLVWTGAAE